VLDKTVKATAVVKSFFPDNVQDRVCAESEEEKADKKKEEKEWHASKEKQS
jgi:hypothetical protein